MFIVFFSRDWIDFFVYFVGVDFYEVYVVVYFMSSFIVVIYGDFYSEIVVYIWIVIFY